MICLRSGPNGSYRLTVRAEMHLCNYSGVTRENRASKSYEFVITSWLLKATNNKLSKRLKR